MAQPLGSVVYCPKLIHYFYIRIHLVAATESNNPQAYMVLFFSTSQPGQRAFPNLISFPSSWNLEKLPLYLHPTISL